MKSLRSGKSRSSICVGGKWCRPSRDGSYPMNVKRLGDADLSSAPPETIFIVNPIGGEVDHRDPVIIYEIQIQGNGKSLVAFRYIPAFNGQGSFLDFKTYMSLVQDPLTDLPYQKIDFWYIGESGDFGGPLFAAIVNTGTFHQMRKRASDRILLVLQPPRKDMN